MKKPESESESVSIGPLLAADRRGMPRPLPPNHCQSRAYRSCPTGSLEFRLKSCSAVAPTVSSRRPRGYTRPLVGGFSPARATRSDREPVVTAVWGLVALMPRTASRLVTWAVTNNQECVFSFLVFLPLHRPSDVGLAAWGARSLRTPPAPAPIRYCRCRTMLHVDPGCPPDRAR